MVWGPFGADLDEYFKQGLLKTSQPHMTPGAQAPSVGRCVLSGCWPEALHVLGWVLLSR